MCFSSTPLVSTFQLKTAINEAFTSYFITVTTRKADLKGQMPQRLIHSTCSVQKDWCIWEDLCVANIFQIWVYYVSGRIWPQVSLSFLKHVATERGMLQLLQRNPQTNLSFLQEKNELLGLGYQSNVDCCCLMSHGWQKAKNKRW